LGHWVIGSFRSFLDSGNLPFSIRVGTPHFLSFWLRRIYLEFGRSFDDLSVCISFIIPLSAETAYCQLHHSSNDLMTNDLMTNDLMTNDLNGLSLCIVIPKDTTTTKADKLTNNLSQRYRHNYIQQIFFLQFLQNFMFCFGENFECKKRYFR